MATYQPTPPEKIDALEHVFYEIKMCLDTGTALINYRGPQLLQNVFLESFLVHCRCLIDFFEHPKSQDDDVLHKHYVGTVTIVNIPELDREKLNKDVAHLTYTRNSRDKSVDGWDIGKTLRLIMEPSLIFLQNLSAFTNGTKWENDRLLLVDKIQKTQPIYLTAATTHATGSTPTTSGFRISYGYTAGSPFPVPNVYYHKATSGSEGL